jgi:site-specific DNA-cytosine methylase
MRRRTLPRNSDMSEVLWQKLTRVAVDLKQTKGQTESKKQKKMPRENSKRVAMRRYILPAGSQRFTLVRQRHHRVGTMVRYHSGRNRRHRVVVCPRVQTQLSGKKRPNRNGPPSSPHTQHTRNPARQPDPVKSSARRPVLVFHVRARSHPTPIGN